MRNQSLYEPQKPEPNILTGFWPNRFSIQIIKSDYDGVLGSAVIQLSHIVKPAEVRKALKRIGYTLLEEDLEWYGSDSFIRYAFTFSEIGLIKEYFKGQDDIRIYEILPAYSAFSIILDSLQHRYLANTPDH